MSVRPWFGIVSLCGMLAAAAACDGSNLFGSGTVTTDGTTGTGTVQGTVLSGGTGLGAVPVILVGRDSTTTTSAGVFAFDSLPAATYQLTVRVPLGYTLAAGQTATQSVSVSSGATTGATFILQQTTTVP